MPPDAVQRKARLAPPAVDASPTTTEPLSETSYAALPIPPSAPRSCIPPAVVHRNALPFEATPTTAEPSADTLYAALSPPPGSARGIIPVAAVHRKAR